jgi:hypothetical protein
MNFRHATALALVGWYLMVPPGHNKAVDTNAPLSRWAMFLSFDTAKECERAGDKLRAMFRDSPEFKSQGQQLSEAVVCVASDDPRLK